MFIEELIALPEFTELKELYKRFCKCFEEYKIFEANCIRGRDISNDYGGFELDDYAWYDYYMEEMEDVVSKTLAKLNLDVSLTRTIIDYVLQMEYD